MKRQKCLMFHIFCWLETSATMRLKLFLPCRYITTGTLFALFICLITLSWWWKPTVQPGLCLNDLEFSEYGLGMRYWLRKASDERNCLLHPMDHTHGKLWNTCIWGLYKFSVMEVFVCCYGGPCSYISSSSSSSCFIIIITTVIIDYDCLLVLVLSVLLH